MAHQRNRAILPTLLKTLRYHPVVGVLGARQTGKSTLIRDLLKNELPRLNYLTLDKKDVRTIANERPDYFLESQIESGHLLCIDEIQKVPDLFDSIKAAVDEDRKPGIFLISGSVGFSRKIGIRESLTGRIRTLRLYPMTIAESLSQAANTLWDDLENLSKTKSQSRSSSDVHRWLETGGLPLIAFTRDSTERHSVIEAWLETTFLRDLTQFKIRNFDPDLARDLFTAINLAEHPDLATLAKHLKTDARKLNTYLEAFQEVFIVTKINPSALGIGKPIYLPFDAGIAAHLGASLHRRAQILFMNEFLSHTENRSGGRPKKLSYYRSPKGSRIDFIISDSKSTQAFLITTEEKFSPYSIRGFKKLIELEKAVSCFVVYPGKTILKVEKHITLIPWGVLF